MAKYTYLPTWPLLRKISPKLNKKVLKHFFALKVVTTAEVNVKWQTCSLERTNKHNMVSSFNFMQYFNLIILIWFKYFDFHANFNFMQYPYFGRIYFHESETIQRILYSSCLSRILLQVEGSTNSRYHDYH